MHNERSASGLRRSPFYILDDDSDLIFVRGDIFPDKNSRHPRDIMSVRSVIAHEYYGHRTFRGTSARQGSWNDEFRASYTAAKIAPCLTDNDRRHLLLDAIERAKEAGVVIEYNHFIGRMIYGID